MASDAMTTTYSEEKLFIFSKNCTLDEPLSQFNIRGRFPTLCTEEIGALEGTIADEEVRKAVFSMGPLKAPGMHGIHALFYQNQWSVVGPSVCKLVRDVAWLGVPRYLTRWVPHLLSSFRRHPHRKLLAIFGLLACAQCCIKSSPRLSLND